MSQFNFNNLYGCLNTFFIFIFLCYCSKSGDFAQRGDTEHFSIYKLEAFSAAKNGMYTGPLNSVDRMNVFYGRFKDNPVIKSLIDDTYDKLMPIFNRIIK